MRGDARETVITKPSNHRLDGIISGIIVSALAFPLLFGAVALGLFMLYGAISGDAPMIIAGMGVVFTFGGLGLICLFASTLMNFFPVKWIIQRLDDTSWCMRKYVGGIRTFKCVCHEWSFRCLPSYQRGDWGYYFVIHCGSRKSVFSPPAVFSESKSDARRLAERDKEALLTHFGVSCEMNKLE